MRNTIILMRGLPGSGKTTLSKRYQEASRNAVRLSRDEDRMQYFGVEGVASHGQERLISRIQHMAATEAIRSGYDVIVDACNLHEDSAKAFSGIAPVVAWDVPTPFEECVQRDASRPRSVGAGVIARMATRYGVPDDGTLPAAPNEVTWSMIGDVLNV